MGITYFRDNAIGFIAFGDGEEGINVLTPEVIERLGAVLDEVMSRQQVRALVLFSRCPGVFVAGADIGEIEGLTDSVEAEAKARAGQWVLDKLEDLPIPTIAVIDGVALGGGCELALACRYRVATFNPKVRIGLPEVKLGIVPGFGGTYRMVRLLGLTEALPLILSGRTLDGRRALRKGLVDRLTAIADVPAWAYEFVGELEEGWRPRRRRPSAGRRFFEGTGVGRALFFLAARRDLRRRTKGFYPAPEAALGLIRRTCRLRRERALQLEARTFGRLAVGEVCKNLIHVFHLSQTFGKPKAARGVPEVRRAAVVGAGVMGGGIAYWLSAHGVNVRLRDVRYEAVAGGLKTAADLFAKATARRRITAAEARMGMARIGGMIDASGLRRVECVIEAVTEDLDLKKRVFEEIGRIVPSSALLCSNTSALSVSEMAARVCHPERVVGFHFFNPVQRMPLVEVIRGRQTSEETVTRALGLARQLGKTAIVVKDAPGFLINRILLMYLLEAGRLLEEGCGIREIDRVAEGFGLPVGPLALADQVGLDVGLKVMKTLHAELGDRFTPPDLFTRLPGMGLLGRKNGRGFYVLRGGRWVPNPRIGGPVRRCGCGRVGGDARDRMIFTMINEAARCLSEGIVAGADEVDVGTIMGMGFPAFRGGLLRFADHVGVGRIVERLREFAQRYGERSAPCPLIEDLAGRGRGFYAERR